MMDLSRIRGDSDMVERYILATHKYDLEYLKKIIKPDMGNLLAPVETLSSKVATGHGFILSGKTGTGKTMLATSVVKVAAAIHGGIVSINADNMIACVSNVEGYSISGIHLSERLFIDDVGREKLKYMEFGEEIKPFECIVNDRYDANIGSLSITTNLSVKDFQNRYGDRTLSRLIEMSGKFIIVKGSNFRYEQAKAD